MVDLLNEGKRTFCSQSQSLFSGLPVQSSRFPDTMVVSSESRETEECTRRESMCPRIHCAFSGILVITTRFVTIILPFRQLS